MKTSLKISTAVLSALIATNCFAQASIIQKSIGLTTDASAVPASGEIYFAYDLLSSNEWGPEVTRAAEPTEGFKSFETWNVGADTNETIIYKSEAAFVVEKSLEAINPSRLMETDFLNTVDPGFKHQETSANVINEAYVKAVTEGYTSARQVPDDLLKRRKITSDERNKQVAAIESQYQANIGHKWCESSDVKCIFSSAAFPTSFQIAITGLNVAGDDFPSSLDMFSELREMNAEELSAVNGSYGIIQTSPLANKTIVSMKNKIIFKVIDANRTLVVIENLTVLEKDDLDRFQFLGSYDFILGTSFMLNRDEGIAMGLPPYNQKMADVLRQSL